MSWRSLTKHQVKNAVFGMTPIPTMSALKMANYHRSGYFCC